MCFHFLDGSCKTYCPRDIFGAAAKTALLTATEAKRMKGDAVREIERADTFRPATFRRVQS